jgi:NADH dehydrogenase
VEERQARGGVLVLGGGFAGGYVARLLGARGATIVSPENFMLFTPLLPEAASGTLEPRHTVVPLRAMCPSSDLLLGTASAVDLEARTATIETDAGTQVVRWQELVLAIGAVPRTVPVPGLGEHGLSFKTLDEAIHLRNHVLRQLEAADAELDDTARRARLGFVFVGAGYAGVEALAELSDLVDDAIRYYPRLRDVPRRWVLVDAAPKILPEIPSRLGDYAAQELERRGFELHVGTTLESVSDRDVVLGDGTRIPARTLVWTAGVRPNPLLAQLGLPLDDRGRVEVDEFLRVRGLEHVWSLGYCARVPNTRAEQPDPPTCQHALRQARRLAKNIEGDLEPYGYRMLGQVATLGRYKGIADVLGLRLRGFPGWFVTRSYHLYQLPLLSRKLRVVVDWSVALLFRRDQPEKQLPGSIGSRTTTRTSTSSSRTAATPSSTPACRRRGRRSHARSARSTTSRR